MSRLTNVLICVLALALSTCKAQQKSTEIQTINGTRFYIHKIEKKQSLYSISRLYKVPLDTLFALNPELKAGAKAGQQIRIPVVNAKSADAAADSAKYITHTIARGETIYSISRRYNLTEKQLVALNPSLSAGAKEGQVIIVGEKKRRSREVRADSLKITQLPVDTAAFLPPAKPRKNRYNVSLLLPFRLDQAGELDADMLLRTNKDFPPIPAIAVDFFLGCKKACDSLQTDSFAVNLQLFDIDDNDSANIKNLMNDRDFNASDLVVGPLFASSFRTVSGKAAQLQVPIVSPFTKENKILFNNIFISKTNPSQYTLLEELADYCIDSLSAGSNFILMTVSEKDRKEADYTEAFRLYFNDRMAKADRPADTVRTARGVDGMKKVFSDSLRNVVIALSTNQVFIADFTTQLAIHAAEKDVILCGWQSVSEMDNIDQGYLNQLRYTFPHQYDVTKEQIPALDKFYRHHQNTAPAEYYFYTGFDVMFYYLKNLRQHGPGFVHRLEQYPGDGAYLRYRFTRPDLTTGFDNRGVFIFRYNEYQIQKTGWK